MKQKLWGRLALLALCLTLCFVLLPSEASADDVTWMPGVWLGGVDVVANPTGSGPNGGSYSYDATTNTLTLTDYVAEGSHYLARDYDTVTKAGIYLYVSTGPFNLNLVGDCRLGGTNNLVYQKNDSKIRTIGIAGGANSDI